jgi:dCTP deaminase
MIFPCIQSPSQSKRKSHHNLNNGLNLVGSRDWKLGLLADIDIKRALKEGEISITDYDESYLLPASYDMRLGNEAFKSSPPEKIDVPSKGILVVEPGQFVIFTTYESVKLSTKMAGHLGVRSHYTRKGLVPLLGPQLDPGFNGKVSVNVYNVGTRDIVIPYRDPILTVEFYELDRPASKPYSGPYQGQQQMRPEDIQFLVETRGATLRDALQTVSALASSVKALTDSIKWVKWSFGLFGTITVAILVILVDILLRLGH